MDLSGDGRAEKLRQLRVRLGQLPADDPVMNGLLAWQEERLLLLLRECDDRNLTGEQALSLVHRIAETAAFRADLERVWKEERRKAEAGK
jgi:hypothetical protein